MTSEFYNAKEHLNQRCELGNMAIWVGHYPGTTPWNNKGLGLMPNTAYAWVSITPSIFFWMKQVKDPSACLQNVDANNAVFW